MTFATKIFFHSSTDVMDTADAINHIFRILKDICNSTLTFSTLIMNPGSCHSITLATKIFVSLVSITKFLRYRPRRIKLFFTNHALHQIFFSQITLREQYFVCYATFPTHQHSKWTIGTSKNLFLISQETMSLFQINKK